jgi:serine/threonine-protein kinase HipA
MALWCLADAARHQRIGTISLQDQRRKVGLTYAPEWIASTQGFALSEDMPLQAGLMLPAEQGTAAGAIDDARPDQWGERVIRLIQRPARLSLLEYLYFAGDDRFGALGVSLHMDAYVPADGAALPSFDGLADMHQAVRRVMAGEAISEQLRRHARAALKAINRFPVCEPIDLMAGGGGLNPATARATETPADGTIIPAA